jgi:hypothetical protein
LSFAGTGAASAGTAKNAAPKIAATTNNHLNLNAMYDPPQSDASPALCSRDPPQDKTSLENPPVPRGMV